MDRWIDTLRSNRGHDAILQTAANATLAGQRRHIEQYPDDVAGQVYLQNMTGATLQMAKRVCPSILQGTEVSRIVAFVPEHLFFDDARIGSFQGIELTPIIFREFSIVTEMSGNTAFLLTHAFAFLNFSSMTAC